MRKKFSRSGPAVLALAMYFEMCVAVGSAQELPVSFVVHEPSDRPSATSPETLTLVLGGDINAAPEHPGFAAWEASGLHDGETDPGIGIDRILVRGLDLVGAPRRLVTSVRELPHATVAGPRRVLLSDHDPVEATVRAPE